MEPGTHVIKLVVSAGTHAESTDSVTMTVSGNNYPIVLIHGFAGWGRDEINVQIGNQSLGLKYWGCQNGDIQQRMINEGFNVYTADCGPLNSMYERACEVWAKIRGVSVTYGTGYPNFVSKDGSETRTGNSYIMGTTGNDKPLGANGFSSTTINLVSNSNGDMTPVGFGPGRTPVHLVGHSMGGITARTLAELLCDGSPFSEDTGELFEGGHTNYIRSITTLSSPHDGTDLTYLLGGIFDLVKIFGIDVTGDILSNDLIVDLLDPIYDLDFDFWYEENGGSLPEVDIIDGISYHGAKLEDLTQDMDGNAMAEGATELGYNGCPNNDIDWTPTLIGTVLWDAHPCGAAQMNNGDFYNNDGLNAQPTIYYYSFATEQTFEYTGPKTNYCDSLIPGWCDQSDFGGMGGAGNFYAETSFPTLLFDAFTNREGVYAGTDKDGGNMCPLFIPFSDMMGSYSLTTNKGLLAAEWGHNDGIVNTNQAIKPNWDDPYGNNPLTTNPDGEPGKWYTKMLHADHLDIVGGLLDVDTAATAIANLSSALLPGNGTNELLNTLLSYFSSDEDNFGTLNPEYTSLDDFYIKHFTTLYRIPEFEE